jgi:hypothetical protein
MNVGEQMVKHIPSLAIYILNVFILAIGWLLLTLFPTGWLIWNINHEGVDGLQCAFTMAAGTFAVYYTHHEECIFMM